MNDEELNDVWTTLEPTVSQRRRITVRLSTRLDAHDTSLAAEWLALLKVSPFATIGLATVSAVALAAAPLVWFARALM